MSRRLLLATAAVPVALLFALSGCGKSGDNGNTVASVNGTASASASPNKTRSAAEEQERALKFAQCMREHGVDMPDPEIKDGKIQMRINAQPGTNIDAAQQACKDYAPEGGPGGKPDAEMQKKQLDFAKCMREHGVEKFPDPDPNQGGVRIDGSIAEDPDFPAAQKACDSIMGGPAMKETKGA
ncbi:MAG: hypothetical protein HOU81_11210 [Hamadaea sp.]|uniref:hypothetical protein n=1 Tax=Hamadaea sp. TaxID=2024425 RepID=UPI00182D9B67|nr:hypothetical protein [Hamadaea sp.]NUR71380.1 hypothetical protein [Hamadaea sp.]NUT22677.1 hypothetical protein [Hamadaea sp.]